ACSDASNRIAISPAIAPSRAGCEKVGTIDAGRCVSETQVQTAEGSLHLLNFSKKSRDNKHF
ncbi:MAG TPA: hypothetical protein VJR87_10685, partial [Allosphingosinicella sp.]|nr:hypothetical protein [Allosphingosinicella sp.]